MEIREWPEKRTGFQPWVFTEGELKAEIVVSQEPPWALQHRHIPNPPGAFGGKGIGMGTLRLP